MGIEAGNESVAWYKACWKLRMQCGMPEPRIYTRRILVHAPLPLLHFQLSQTLSLCLLSYSERWGKRVISSPCMKLSKAKKSERDL